MQLKTNTATEPLPQEVDDYLRHRSLSELFLIATFLHEGGEFLSGVAELMAELDSHPGHLS